MADPARILCLDGGGVRGVLQARLLQRLAREVEFLPKVTHYAGSSIGVVNAVWLALGRDPEELVGLYRKAAPFIFGGARGPIASAFAANATKMALKATLERYVGKISLGDLPRPLLAGALAKTGPVFFDSTRDKSESVVDVVLAATAAPIALPSHKGMVDGGVLANDPSALALAWVTTQAEPREVDALLSIGTGTYPSRPTTFFGGLLRAAATGQAVAGQAACVGVLQERYRRLQTELPREIGLSESGAVDELVEIADAEKLDDVARWIKTRFVERG